MLFALRSTASMKKVPSASTWRLKVGLLSSFMMSPMPLRKVTVSPIACGLFKTASGFSGFNARVASLRVV